MIARKDASYLADIERLSLSIQKGNIKNIDKTEAKLKNHNKKHKIAAEKYNATILCSEEGKAQCIEVTAKTTESNPLSGCYVIDSTHLELDEVEIWKLTQVHVECIPRHERRVGHTSRVSSK